MPTFDTSTPEGRSARAKHAAAHRKGGKVGNKDGKFSALARKKSASPDARRKAAKTRRENREAREAAATAAAGGNGADHAPGFIPGNLIPPPGDKPKRPNYYRAMKEKAAHNSLAEKKLDVMSKLLDRLKFIEDL